MSGLTRVPAPGSPFHRGSAIVVGGVLIATIAALAVDPWGPPAIPSVTAVPSLVVDRPEPSVRAAPEVATRVYVPEAFGAAPDGSAWEVRTAGSTVALPAMDATHPGSIASGPVVHLGSADSLDAIVLSGPAGSTVETIRLWRFDDLERPRRLDLDELPAPWAVDHAWTVGLRAAERRDDVVGAWTPGLYRMDVLANPGGRVRMIMLSVDATVGERATDAGPMPTVVPEPFRPSILSILPDSATVWTYGGLLTGWARGTAAAGCQVAEIWRADEPDAPCRAVPIGPTSALGVNLPAGERVVSIALTQVDPLPGLLELSSAVAIDGRPGLAAVWSNAPGLPDGVHHLQATTATGRSFHWYVEAGPDGRRTEAINAQVATR